jgi:hypothetical protein
MANVWYGLALESKLVGRESERGCGKIEGGRDNQIKGRYVTR